MKKLLKLTLILSLSFITTQLTAQRVGLRFGLNSATMLAKDNQQTYSDDYEKLKGFTVGPVLELPMNDEGCFFETGLLLSQKGFKLDKTTKSTSPELESSHISSETSLYYLDIPLTMKRTLLQACDLKLYMTMGGYTSIGISGETAQIVTETNSQASRTATSQTNEVAWGTDSEDEFKRLDYGMTMGAGLQINKVAINLSYAMGLANLSTDQSADRKSKNKVMSLSVSYFLGK